MLGAGQKIVDVGGEVVDIAKDIYKIGAAVKAYAEGNYDNILKDLEKALKEICEELGMVLSHPIEALEGMLNEKVEAIANATPEDQGYLSMDIILDFVGPAAIKKAGRVVKIVAKHLKPPGVYNLAKTTDGGMAGDAISKLTAEALDGDGSQEEPDGKEDTEYINKEIEIVNEKG